MTLFPIHRLDSAPVESRATMEAIQARFGFLPNLIGELAAAPSAVQAYATLNELLGRTSLSPVEQQIVLLAVSRANGCHYCVAAHSAGLKMAGGADEVVGAMRDGRPLEDSRLEALRSFATAIVEHRGHLKSDELRRFLDAGYRAEQILDVLVGVAMKTLSNYTNHIAETPLDTQLQPFAWEPAAAGPRRT